LKQLQTMRMLKYNLQQSVLTQLIELEQLKEQLVYHANELNSLMEYAHVPKLKFQLILANNHAMKLRILFLW
jgi:hypothetical protein